MPIAPIADPSSSAVEEASFTPLLDNDQDATLFSISMLKWPRRHGPRGITSSERLNTLRKAIHDIKKMTTPRAALKSQSITGPLFQQYYNVLCFLKLQAFQEKQALLRPNMCLLRSRKTLAKQVADGSQSGQRVWRRILRNEVSWIQFRKIKAISQGQHQKIASMFNDESTWLAVREYISSSGQSKFINSFLFHFEFLS